MLFESKHIQELIGIDKNRLFFWVQTKGLICPEQQGRGRGGCSRFSFGNLLDIALIKELRDFGINFNEIKKILQVSKGTGCLIVTQGEKENPKIVLEIDIRQIEQSLKDTINKSIQGDINNE